MVLPLSRRLQALFASRVADLPAPTLAAPARCPGRHRGPARPGGSRRAARDGDLAPAEQAGLVHVDERIGRLVFRHPLTRSAVVELSTSSERRRAHRALAAQLADQPDRRAWHLAAAAAGPDEEAAGRLEQVAHRFMRRGDATGAVTALLRAADLSSAGPGRSRRLAEAAHVGATMTGEAGSVSQLLSCGP